MQTPGFDISAGTPGTGGAPAVGAIYVGFGTVHQVSLCLSRLLLSYLLLMLIGCQTIVVLDH